MTAVNALRKEAAKFIKVIDNAYKEQELRNALITTFLWSEVPHIFGISIKTFKNGLTNRESMARYIFFYLADKHGENICQSDLANKLGKHRSQVKRGIEMIKNAHHVKVGYEIYIEKSIEIEKNLVKFLKTAR